MKNRTYYTNNNEITKINYLLFDKKKLLIVYKINGKEYVTTAKYRNFTINVSSYYVNM